MNDYCIRAIAANAQIRAFAIDSTSLVATACRIHKTSATASAALGRTLTATSLMGILAGNENDLITISIRGDGALGGILTTADGLGRVRGYVHNPMADAPPKQNGKLDVSKIVGQGTITVIKDLGLKEPYSGTLELVSGEIAEDIAQYFGVSEQIPTILSLGVLVDTDLSIRAAGGFLIQLMPFYDEALIDQLEGIIKDFPPVTSLIDSGKKPEDILDLLLSKFGYEITEKKEVSYHCNCSKERVHNSLATISKKELQEMIKQDGKAEINCSFCNSDYIFSKEELLAILEGLTGGV